MHTAAAKILVQGFLGGHKLSFLLSKYLAVELQGHGLVNFSRPCHMVFQTWLAGPLQRSRQRCVGLQVVPLPVLILVFFICLLSAMLVCAVVPH